MDKKVRRRFEWATSFALFGFLCLAPAPVRSEPVPDSKKPPTGDGDVQPTVKGAVDKLAILSVIRTHRDEVHFCYEVGRKFKPQMQGQVHVQFTIGSNGYVSDAKLISSTVNHEKTEQCVIARLKTWKFPQPKGDGVQVTYPFVLKPADK